MNFVSYNQFINDSIELISRLPKCDGVAGVPRSGIIPALIASQQLHLPVHIIGSGWLSQKYGTRLKTDYVPQTVLLFEDSVWTGTHITLAKNALLQSGVKHVITASLYVANEAKTKVDHYHSVINPPRIYEWNIFQSAHLKHTLCDFDGIYCKDPPPDNDDPTYINYITNCKPIRHIPIMYGIVTCRLERYRNIMRKWLAHTGMNVGGGNIHMMPYNTAAERRQAGQHAQWKAKVYQEDAKARLFIESNVNQGRTIANLSGKPVLIIDDVNNIKELIERTK